LKILHLSKDAGFFNSLGNFLCYDSMNMNRRRLILYLLLNVVVSACVTGGILYWYHQNYRSTSISVIPPALPANPQNGTPAASFDPDVDIPVEIVSIVGAGTLDVESVLVRNAGAESLSLAGWKLQDANRHVFTFPNLTLNTGGAVQVHTISGTNTVIDLYWGLGDSVWGPGEEAQLLDPGGNVRAVYTVP